MEASSPFAQRLNTNYVPTPSEIEEIKRLVSPQYAFLDAIDALIADLYCRREAHAQYINKHTDLISPARRLNADILSTIFHTLVTISGDDEALHPAVIISHVCRQWRDLALGNPLLWANIDMHIPSYPTLVGPHFDHQPQPTQVKDLATAWLISIGMWKQRVQRLAERVTTFIKRSKGCPLHISYTARDPPPILLQVMSAIDDCGWESAVQPLLRALDEGNNDWRSVRLCIKMSTVSSILTLPFRFIQECSEGMKNLDLDVTYYGVEAGEKLWDEVLAEGKVDLRGAAGLTTLSALMPYSDLCRIQTQWAGLTTLSIGVPSKVAVFGPTEAANILVLTPNLVQCTIHFSEGFTPGPFSPPQRVVPLHKLESLSMHGSSVPAEFTSILELPALTHLSAIQNFLASEDQEKSSLVEIVRRCGPHITDISFVYTSLTQSALEYILGLLPNVASIEAVARDRRVSSIELNPNPGAPLPPANSSSQTKFDAALLRRMTPRFASESALELAEDCICPKLQSFRCVLGQGHDEKTKQNIIDLIEARRGVAVRGGLISLLHKVDIEFEVGPVDHIVGTLERRGVDTAGITFSTKYPDHGSVPCSLSFPVPGFGTLDVAMDIGPLGCIHAQRAIGDIWVP